MRSSGAYLVMLLSLLAVAFLSALAVGAFDEKIVPYSEFKTLVQDGEFVRVTYENGVFSGAGKPGADGKDPPEVKAYAVPGDESLFTILAESKVPYAARPAPSCEGMTSMMLLGVMSLVAVWFFLTRPTGGVPPGVATFGKSQAKLAPEEGTGVTFADVAGIDEAEEELNEIVQFLKTPERFTRLGGRIPKGVLLVGPPGTGKTLLARAVAGEAGVPFYSISGSDFVEMFVGVGAARVRDLFKNAAERAPCIIFIDELDAIGKARGAGGPVGGHDEREQTLNQLLVEMDGFDGRKGIIIMAATNRPETLDGALLRAGRFDRQVVVDRPDLRGREAILKVHARSLRIADGVDMHIVAQRTSGFSGADLASALNEAALLAARRGKDAIEFAEIDEAVERMALGVERKSRRISDEERRMTAYHEAGHAVCGAGMPGASTVQKVSIIPRGFTGGVTWFTPPDGRISATRSELLARITRAYGGMAAEELFIGEMSTGARSDIAQASEIARDMVSEYGMSERLGAVNYGSARPSPFGMGPAVRDVAVGDATAREIDAEVRHILDEGLNRARTLVRQNRELMEEMAQTLIERETLDGELLATFMARVRRLEVVPGGHVGQA